MRLGDLDDLKKAFALLMWKEHNPYDTVKVCDVVNQTLDFIDNAPTVEAFTKDEYEGAYLRGFVDSAKANKRPQGKWIEVGDNQPYSKDKLYGCSKCGFGGYLLSDTKNVNFCSNCGADMRGETE